jgi:hypothetical protein
MSSNASKQKESGEPTELELTSDQKNFIEDQGKLLDQVNDKEVLKHFTDTWWNLCQWEKQRLDILDTKAQMLLGLSGLATAILGTGFAEQSYWLRACAAFGFLATMGFAMHALRVTSVGGFIDDEVFGALLAAKTPVGKTQLFSDREKEPYNSYYREIALQRWLIYDFYKKASAVKSKRVKRAQTAAVAAIALAALAVLVPQQKKQADSPPQTNATSSSAPAAAAPTPTSSAPTTPQQSVSSTAVASASAASLTPASAATSGAARP